MNPPWVYMCSPSWTPLPPPSPSHPSGSSSAPALSTLSHALNLDRRSVSHMIIFVFQCYSFRSSDPRLLPESNRSFSLFLYFFSIMFSRPNKEVRVITNPSGLWRKREFKYLDRWCVLCLVAQLCLILWDPTDCSPPVSSVHGDSPGKNTGVGCPALLQGIFPTQGLNPGLPRCRRILYHLSHWGSPKILERVAYLFSRGSSQPRNWTGVSCIAGRFFTSELPEKP